MKNRILKNKSDCQVLKLNDISLIIYQDPNIYNTNVYSSINMSDTTPAHTIDDIIKRNNLAWKELSKL